MQFKTLAASARVSTTGTRIGRFARMISSRNGKSIFKTFLYRKRRELSA